jgi:hypothetical protein
MRIASSSLRLAGHRGRDVLFAVHQTINLAWCLPPTVGYRACSIRSGRETCSPATTSTLYLFAFPTTAYTHCFPEARARALNATFTICSFSLCGVLVVVIE